MEKLFIQKIIKILMVIIIFIVITVLGYLSGGIVKYKIDVRKVDKSVERFQNSLEEPYKKDIYGGKTPEETWAMYLDALKSGDIDLASKYFAVEEQNTSRKLLLEAKQIEKLDFLINIYSQQLNEIQAPIPSAERADYYVLRENEDGKKERDFIIFYFNPQAKIWKIVSL